MCLVNTQSLKLSCIKQNQRLLLDGTFSYFREYNLDVGTKNRKTGLTRSKRNMVASVNWQATTARFSFNCAQRETTKHCPVTPPLGGVRIFNISSSSNSRQSSVVAGAGGQLGRWVASKTTAYTVVFLILRSSSTVARSLTTFVTRRNDDTTVHKALGRGPVHLPLYVSINLSASVALATLGIVCTCYRDENFSKPLTAQIRETRQGNKRFFYTRRLATANNARRHSFHENVDPRYAA